MLFILGHICHRCRKWFATQRTLAKHRLWHHKDECGNFKYNCKECPYATNVMSSMKDHIHVHDKRRPYSCSLCGNRFTAASSLSAHVLIHTGEQNCILHV